jgi:hypothetical protein
MNKEIIGMGIICVVLLIIYVTIPSAQRAKIVVQKQSSNVITNTVSVEEYAAKLKKDYDAVHIYAVSNCFIVWCNHKTKEGRWAEANTIEEARKIVDDYYKEWARNCMGPTPPGKLVE